MPAHFVSRGVKDMHALVDISNSTHPPAVERAAIRNGTHRSHFQTSIIVFASDAQALLMLPSVPSYWRPAAYPVFGISWFFLSMHPDSSCVEADVERRNPCAWPFDGALAGCGVRRDEPAWSNEWKSHTGKV